MAKIVGSYRKISGKFYTMYYRPNLIIDCSKVTPKGKWNLTKKTDKGTFKLSRHRTRTHCLRALKREIGV